MNKVEIFQTKLHHKNDGNYHDCDATFLVTDKLAPGSVSILPIIGEDMNITQAFQMTPKQALRLAHAIFSNVLVSDEGKMLLVKLESIIES